MEDRPKIITIYDIFNQNYLEILGPKLQQNVNDMSKFIMKHMHMTYLNRNNIWGIGIKSEYDDM